jgi:predicted component of type VI protein secretion system
MFLERKFMTPTERHALLEQAGALARLPERVQDVVRNLERLLATERGIGHVLPDYGLSHSGHWSVEGVIAHATAELRETLPRYEARLALDDIEAELDDDGRPLLLMIGRIGDARVTLTIDPLRRRVHAVHLG